MAGRPDNVRVVELGGKTYEVEASLGAGIAYKNEFFGRLEEPYVGSLDDDLLKLWHRAQPTTDVDGEQVPNPDYDGVDVVALLRLLWAMWAARDKRATSWEKFEDRALHANVSTYEVHAAFATIVGDLGGSCTFRRPKGQAGADAADEEQEA